MWTKRKSEYRSRPFLQERRRVVTMDIRHKKTLRTELEAPAGTIAINATIAIKVDRVTIAHLQPLRIAARCRPEQAETAATDPLAVIVQAVAAIIVVAPIAGADQLAETTIAIDRETIRGPKIKEREGQRGSNRLSLLHRLQTPCRQERNHFALSPTCCSS